MLHTRTYFVDTVIGHHLCFSNPIVSRIFTASSCATKFLHIKKNGWLNSGEWNPGNYYSAPFAEGVVYCMNENRLIRAGSRACYNLNTSPSSAHSGPGVTKNRSSRVTSGFAWWPIRDSNSCFCLERAASWAARRMGQAPGILPECPCLSTNAHQFSRLAGPPLGVYNFTHANE